MDPLEINWDKIALELKEELDRKPTSTEIQQALMKKYWDIVDTIEKNESKSNN